MSPGQQTTPPTARTTTGRTYRGADRRQRQDERRARLMEAGIETFGTIGYRNATVDRVCAAAGLTKRYFYESFDDSEELLLAVYGRVAEELHTRIVADAEAAAPDIEAQVRAALTALFRTIGDDPRLARIAFVEILAVSGTVDSAWQAVNTAFVDTILQLTQPYLDAADLSETDLEILATGVLGAVVLIAQRWILGERAQPIEALVSNAHTLVMAVVSRVAALD
ncbi:TetR/AcrR family transcriptional regulator [Streptomyces specialis]|uniref:TetR/AcrR family transcriptional regulator n=1 Tax=Streptomyces specialis TaxID=498367 RepID=UPI00073E6BC2|nr:TetR/AcrR family transcriptional regulator [Streptomyces specialis]